MDATPFVLIALYFVPVGIALYRRSRNVMGVAITSLILGWTVIGWIVGLVIALTAATWNDALPVTARPMPMPAQPTPARDEKTCPRCAEMVKSAALACRFCGHEFAQTT